MMHHGRSRCGVAWQGLPAFVAPWHCPTISPPSCASLVAYQNLQLERLREVVPVWHTGVMKRPHASDDVRERALAAIDAGRRVADVAAFFQNDPSTVRRWIRQRRTTGSGLTRPRSGRPRKIPPAQEPALIAQVAAAPDATLAEHCQQWQAGQGVRVSISAMRQRLLALGLTLKKRP
jgi:transposase